MLGATHRLTGALAGATLATAQGHGTAMVVISAAVATATSNGASSPDLDQTDAWVALRQSMPLRVLRRLMNHRALTHWWGLPVAAWWLIGQLEPAAQWAAYALLIGWVSHLAGDAVFGRIPLDPFGKWTVGLGVDTGGWVETGQFKHRFLGRRWRLPFGPTRVVLAALLLWVLAGTPAVPGRDANPSGGHGAPVAHTAGGTR